MDDHFDVGAFRDVILFLMMQLQEHSAAKRVKLNEISAEKGVGNKGTAPGRTDDLTSHSSDEADLDNSHSHGAKSKVKSFNAPKRPKTAYMIFLEKSKALYFDKNPNATFNEYQKYAGQLWRSFTQDEKMVRFLYHSPSRKLCTDMNCTTALDPVRNRISKRFL